MIILRHNLDRKFQEGSHPAFEEELDDEHVVDFEEVPILDR